VLRLHTVEPILLLASHVSAGCLRPPHASPEVCFEKARSILGSRGLDSPLGYSAIATFKVPGRTPPFSRVSSWYSFPPCRLRWRALKSMKPGDVYSPFRTAELMMTATLLCLRERLAGRFGFPVRTFPPDTRSFPPRSTEVMKMTSSHIVPQKVWNVPLADEE